MCGILLECNVGSITRGPRRYLNVTLVLEFTERYRTKEEKFLWFCWTPTPRLLFLVQLSHSGYLRGNATKCSGSAHSTSSSPFSSCTCSGRLPREARARIVWVIPWGSASAACPSARSAPAPARKRRRFRPRKKRPGSWKTTPAAAAFCDLVNVQVPRRAQRQLL